MSYVFLSITTTPGNAYQDGQIVEVGAIKAKTRRKISGSFQVINFVEDLDNYTDVELGMSRNSILSLGESVETWLIRLLDFIGDSKVVLYEGYETYNYLRSYGLDLDKVIDLRLYLKEYKVKNYDDFVKLVGTVKKDKLVVPKGLFKPIMIKELFFKHKLQRKDEEFLNDLYVEDTQEDYSGVYIPESNMVSDIKKDNYLVFSDGSKELVVSEIELYENHLININDKELEYFGETMYKDVLEDFKEMFEDVYFDYDTLGEYYRANIEGNTYLITPTTVYFDDNLNMELLYDTKTMSNRESFKNIEDKVLDSMVADYFKELVKKSDPNYELRDYNYYKNYLGNKVTEINNKLNLFNEKHELLRNKALSNFDLTTLTNDFFTLDIYDTKGLLVFKLEENYLDVNETKTSNVEAQKNPVITLKNDNITYTVDDSDYDVVYDEERYNYVVLETGIKPLEDNLMELSLRLDKVVESVIDSIPTYNTKEYNLEGLDEIKILREYGTMSRRTYTVLGTKDESGQVYRDIVIRLLDRGYQLKLSFNGEVRLVLKTGKEVEVSNVNELLEVDEVLYKMVVEFYNIMDRLFEYSYEDFKVDKDNSIVELGYSSEDEGYEDFEVSDSQEVVSDVEKARVVNTINKEVEVGIKLSNIFKIDDMVAHFNNISKDTGEDTVYLDNAEDQHNQLKIRILDRVNAKLPDTDIEGDNDKVILEDGEVEFKNGNIYMDYKNVALDFINSAEDCYVVYTNKDNL